MKRLYLFLLVTAISIVSYTQEPSGNQTVEDLLESVGEDLSEDTDFQEVLDELEKIRQNPFNINLATRNELLQLHILSEFQIENLIAFRNRTGKIYSIYEMASIEGFTPEVLQKLEPYISFELQDKIKVSKFASNQILIRSNRSFPSDQSKNEGAPERHYFRVKHSSARFEYGFVAEKDPGEAFFTQSNKQGFDYTSTYANVSLGKKGSKLFAGDYRLMFGQGLVVWQGFSIGKSVETTQVLRSGQGVKSYSSTDENQFFRGLAGHIKSGRFTFSPFISSHKVDANVDTLDGKPYFGAFQTSGYHRTSSEISGENALKQFAGGGNVNYSHNRWTFGLTSVYTRFDAVLNRTDEPYNQFLPDGRSGFVSGLDWKGSVKKIFIFGEAAMSKNSGRAFLMGSMMKPASNAELSLVYRNINKTYFSFYSNSFTESSRVNDEQGLYLGLKVFPAPKWNVLAYIDLFKFQWIKYTTSAPSSGTEFMSQISYNPSRKTNLYLRFFQEEKGQRINTELLQFDELQIIKRIRLNFAHDLSEVLSLKSRLEFSFYSKQLKESGMLLFQDIGYRPKGKSFSMNGRIAWYKTDGYNSRLYAYENDLLYSFSIPALYGEGLRMYLNFQQRIGQKFTCWMKFATSRPISESSESETSGTAGKSEIKIQMRYQF